MRTFSCITLQTFLKREAHWVDHVDALNFKVEQLKALANAMHAVAYSNFDFFLMKKKLDEPASLEQLLPLSFLSQRLCDEIDAHVNALHRRLYTYSEEAKADLDDILEKRAQMGPEDQAFIDEVAHYLSVATPEQKAIFALGIEGVKQRAQQRKATHASAKSSTDGKNRVNGPR